MEIYSRKVIPYQFKKEDAFRFANEQGIRTRIHEKELQFLYCPYCKGGENKDTWKFSINLDTGQFNCVRASCGAKGNMLTLQKDFGFSLGKDADEYFTPRKQYRDLPQPEKPYEPNQAVIDYMANRGIPKEICDRYELTINPKNPEWMIFPFYDDKKILQFVKYRDLKWYKGKMWKTQEGEKKASKEYPAKDCKPILYGMWLCDPSEDGILVITEGQIDALSLVTAGVRNAVSVPMGANGFTWIPCCWNWIHRFTELIIFGDCENGTITLVDELTKRLRMAIKIVRQEDYLGCKDANEILQKHGTEQLLKCVENAAWSLPQTVRMVSDIAYDSEEGMIKVPTGLSRLDKILHGGIPSGVVTLITGRAGHGKSTFASQIIANALAKGYPVFAYSGEMPDSKFKQWIDLQIAGPDSVQTRSRPGYDDYYYLTNDVVQKINQWYADRFYVFSTPEDDESSDSLITTVENLIQRYGAKVILLDNLMTAMSQVETKGETILVRQGNFMRRLAQMARTYDVAIILVAHKRKETGIGDANDSVSGSSDIVNLAGVVISYERAENSDDKSRKVRVTKNRLYGTTDYSGWTVEYDPKSKRIYGTGDNVHVDYGWNPDSDGFTDYTEFDFDDADFPFKEGGGTQ